MQAAVYKKSVFTVLFLTLLALLSIIIFNYFIDPGNQFFRAAPLEKAIAQALLDKKKVMFHTNYNDRGVQKLVLEKWDKRPEILVIGSSRSMPISHNAFNQTDFFNASVTSASLEDHVAIYYLYQKKGQPKTVVLNLDPWILDKNHGMKKWKFALFSDYYAGREMILGEKNPNLFIDKTKIAIEKYSQLLSSEYTHVAVRKLLLPKTQDIIIDPEDNACSSCYTRFPDGTRIFSQKQESTTSREAELASIDGIRQYDRDFGQFTQLDTHYTHLFENFIRYMKEKNVTIIFYLPAYSPIAYTTIQTDERYKMIEVAEKYFLDIAKKYDVKVIGGYNPAILSLQNSDFVDDLHLKKQPIENIFKKQRLA